jgi:pilus assembly protein CpaB
MFLRRLLIALVLSLIGSAIFTFWLSTKLKQKPAVKVYYMAPSQDIEAGQVLSKEVLKPVEWPNNVPLNGGFNKPDDLVGRTALYPIAAGEPILDKHLAAIGSGAGLSPHIPEGMRAISLKSDQVTGVAGFLLPGSRVDVLVTYRIKNFERPQDPDQVLTSTVLQDVPVLTAGQQLQPDPTGKPAPTDVVTLLVNPLDAQKATLATAQGTIHFILRNAQDHAHTDDLPTQIMALSDSTNVPQARPVDHTQTPRARIKLPAAAPSAPKVAKPYSVQTISGGKSSVETF